jgi:hypothetical protein
MDQPEISRVGTFFNKLVFRHSVEGNDCPVHFRDYCLVPNVGRYGYTPFLNFTIKAAFEKIRAPFFTIPYLKIAPTSVRHRSLVAVGVPLGSCICPSPQYKHPA